MIRINGDTTLRDLMLLRAQLGVQRVVVDYDYPGNYEKCVRVVLFGPVIDGEPEEVRAVGTGETDILAMDDAFGRLWHREVSHLLGLPVAPEAA